MWVSDSVRLTVGLDDLEGPTKMILCFYDSICTCTWAIPIYVCVYLSTCLSICLLIYLSMHPSMDHVCMSMYMEACEQPYTHTVFL